MKNLKADKRTLIRWKIYIDRARMYIGYVQFIMIGFMFIKVYKDSYLGKLFFENLIISLPLIFLVTIVLSLIIGRLDTIYGLREEELRNSTTSNPVMRELHANIEDIKKDLKFLRNQSNLPVKD
jgi:hypothetical protein